jgi:large subunit ribosomal protein L7/L12
VRVASDQEEIAELKAQVAHLTQLVEQLYYRSGTPAPSNGFPSLDSPPADILDALRSGQKITAIKLWRERTNLGLAEAKDQIDDLERRLGL